MRKYVVGETYGCLKILRQSSSKPAKYIVVCTRCGQEREIPSDKICLFLTGCSTCRAEERLNKAKKYYNSFKGEMFGDLEVLGFCDEKKCANSYLARCKCHKCGDKTLVRFSELLQGDARECSNCAKKHLQLGIQRSLDTSKGGSCLSCTLDRKKLNRNNTTGHRGVTYRAKQNRFHAYLTFQRHQYWLGSYARIEDAIAAREAAEKEIYGSFVEWYQNTYPDLWEKYYGKKQN